MESEPKNVVYGLKLKYDDEIRYVGITTYGMKTRFQGHVSEAKGTRSLYPVHKWMRIHPNEVVPVLLEVCDDLANLEFREQFWIATFREQVKTGIKRKSLLNLSDGGFVARGFKHSEEWKRELSRRLTGEGNHMYGKTGELAPCYGRVGELHPMFGKHHTDEAKASMAEKLRGRKDSAEVSARKSAGQSKRMSTEYGRRHARRNMHIRWHVNRNMTNKDCEFCTNDDS